MRELIPEKLERLAGLCPAPLYLVGGTVRDYLCGFARTARPDFDLCSPMKEEQLLAAAEKCGFAVKSVYRNTGTVKLTCDGAEYEFTRFRSDKYVRGLHTPSEIEFTDNILRDARRRDFRANAIYYDVARGEFSDPLGGMDDIKNKLLRTVAPAEKVFGEDGLRLLRLARFAAQLGFEPDEECLLGARENAALIRDIVPERIFSELNALLLADGKHGVKDGPYRGLEILNGTDVLGHILPELKAGDGLGQRSDFHDHDVLEHSLRCVRYSDPGIRFAALLHDVGKPFCYFRDGSFYAHPEEGARIARDILTRLKAPKKLTEETERLVLLHMRDYNLLMKEGKLRREFTENYEILEKLLLLKQADFSACKDDLSPAPCVVKWRELLAKMRAEGAPLRISELRIDGSDILALGVRKEEIGDILRELLGYCAQDGSRNRREALLARVKKRYGGKS